VVNLPLEIEEFSAVIDSIKEKVSGRLISNKIKTIETLVHQNKRINRR